MRSLALFALAAGLVACGADTTTSPTGGSVLAGLTTTSTHDTVVSTNPVPTGPGYFQGNVLGPSAAGAGNDSLTTAPRIAGVVVSIYTKVATGDGTVQAGDLQGTVTTGGDGKFKLPTLPAGDYIVTFVPPANSGYLGVYAFGPLNANSNLYAWWIVLPKK